MKLKHSILGAAIAIASIQAQAQQLDINITNLTQGIYFTPFLVAAHNADGKLFTVGAEASANLQMMAEGGDISGLSSDLGAISADINENPAEGLLAPAMSTSLMLDTTEGNNYLSIVSMLLPTNDGFVGLNSWMIPEEPGTYTIDLSAYDAGTEANDEVVNGGGAPGMLGIPVDPSGHGGTGASGVTDMESNTMIHIHRGSLGDDDVAGGNSDLNNTVHRWLNPVVRITVTVN
ncbi:MULTISPECIES: spondin domain-containing protein [Thalassotalea]|uniref:spondin domain-containing protein n=1 Tax=Thalassotalea TaxID=1518149 RepID=UPI000944DBC5|nr:MULTISPECIES: spondin domain-containing protein [Thalassotalea]OKY27245.1 hypothetical protein BI291_09550 [Thalassotalea sp. PP2-459]